MVLDDDLTGVQTVHDVAVVTDWREDSAPPCPPTPAGA